MLLRWNRRLAMKRKSSEPIKTAVDAKTLPVKRG
jgi:hypothetical protein